MILVNLVVNGHLDDVHDRTIMRDRHRLEQHRVDEQYTGIQRAAHLGLAGRTAGKVEKGDLGLGFAGLELALDETLVHPQTLLYEVLHGGVGTPRDLAEHDDACLWYACLTRSGHGRAQRH